MCNTVIYKLLFVINKNKQKKNKDKTTGYIKSKYYVVALKVRNIVKFIEH